MQSLSNLCKSNNHSLNSHMAYNKQFKCFLYIQKFSKRFRGLGLNIFRAVVSTFQQAELFTFFCNNYKNESLKQSNW